MKDNISDMITRIRNGQKAKLFEIVLFWPTPKICLNILDLLKNEGFISGYKKVALNNKTYIYVLLKYTELLELFFCEEINKLLLIKDFFVIDLSDILQFTHEFRYDSNFP